HGACAQRHVDARLHSVTDLERAGPQRTRVAVHVGLDLLRVADLEGAGRAYELATVADLAARLGVERRAIEHHGTPIAALPCLHLHAFPVEGNHFRRQDQRIVTVELGLAALILEAGRGGTLGGRARPLALLLHRRLEARHVDAHAA